MIDWRTLLRLRTGCPPEKVLVTLEDLMGRPYWKWERLGVTKSDIEEGIKKYKKEVEKKT